ncbi:putative thymidylate kinase [Pseudomonas phage pPa_SNUABM_DT01]|nr:putative thymidylate kinase [Pseudomonas phage pPa_SNUABM_DT01]
MLRYQPTHKGFLLAIEGPDGAGKSTLRTWLSDWFQSHGITAVITREPGGTPEAEMIRQDILRKREPHEEPVCALTQALKFMAARAQHIDRVLKPNIVAGELVITDRFCDSTFAYQSQEGVDLGKLRAMHDVAFDGFKPDLTILLDGDPNIFRERMAGRGEGALNFYDLKPMSFHEQSRRVYSECASMDANRYAVIDATQNFEQVQAQIIPYLMDIDAWLRKRPA